MQSLMTAASKIGRSSLSSSSSSSSQIVTNDRNIITTTATSKSHVEKAATSFYVYIDAPRDDEPCQQTTSHAPTSLQQAFENYRKSKIVTTKTSFNPSIMIL